MLTATLRSVGGSVMMAIPKPVLDSLGLAANEKVALRVEGGELVIAPHPKPKYSLGELLAQCDASAPATAGLNDWTGGAPAGREAI